MSKKSRSDRKEYYKQMEKSEEAIKKRLLKDLNRFKDKDQFELEDIIINLEQQIKDLKAEINKLSQPYGGFIDTPIMHPSDDLFGQTTPSQIHMYQTASTHYVPVQSPTVATSYGFTPQPPVPTPVSASFTGSLGNDLVYGIAGGNCPT